MQSDIGQIIVDAQDWENKYGRDHGNGWLMNHPLRKLLFFQHYLDTVTQTREEPAAEEAAPAPATVADATVAVPAFAVGTRIAAKWIEAWFCAVIVEVHANGSYEVEWVDEPNVFNTIAAADVRAAAAGDCA
jgi:hypothetical protein